MRKSSCFHELRETVKEKSRNGAFKASKLSTKGSKPNRKEGWNQVIYLNLCMTARPSKVAEPNQSLV